MLFWLLACGGAPEVVQGPEALSGTWQFEEECGTTSGGSAVVVQYTLSVKGSQASLSADGYQTMLRAEGSLLAKDDGRIEFIFENPGKEGAFSGLYHTGDKLITFQLVDEVLQGTPNKLSFQCSPTLNFERKEG